jgi:hypothetical protein
MADPTKEAALANTLVDIARDYFRCVCTEDYTGRGLTDPQCNAHDGVAEDLARAAAALRTPAPVAEPVADALRLIGDERCRQVVAEGWTLDHDDQHTDGSLAIAAAHYALSSQWWRSSDFRVLAPAGSDEQREKILARGPLNFGGGNDCYNWPWDLDWWKPKGQVEDLVRAGALIVAEIERIARASTPIAFPADMEGTNGRST